jgi:outer membrane protein TolC
MAVVAACLDARAAGELSVSDESSLRSIESQLKEVRARVEQGAALRSDQLSLEVRLAEARERRLHTQLGMHSALATLRCLLALEGDVPIELDSEPFRSFALPSSLSAARELAFAQRAELQSAKHALLRADLEIESARRAWLPRLDLEGRWYAGENDYSLSLNEPNSTVALSLSYPLFEGGARRAELSRAKANRAEFSAAELRLRSSIGLEVDLAWMRREEARARVEVAGQALGASQETLQLVETQFRSGAATVTRFLEAEAARSAAESSLIRARLDLERSDAEVARAVGLLAGDEGESR